MCALQRIHYKKLNCRIHMFLRWAFHTIDRQPKPIHRHPLQQESQVGYWSTTPQGRVAKVHMADTEPCVS